MLKMFKYIAESVLNEISAEDAYNKFYKSIKKETFDTILNEYGGKFDAVIKFIFNNIRDYNDSFIIRNNALKFIKLYKSSENNVRMEFLKRFKEGQYEDIADAINGINEIQKEGVSTVKTRQNEGYVQLFNNKKYLLSATLTYEANQHFYGHTKWCTASDRFGRYDGWYYFLTYVFDVDYVREESVYDNLGTSKYPLKCVLVQFIDKEKNKTYQVQLFKNGTCGQICDEEDTSIEKVDFINNIMPKDFMSVFMKNINVLMELEENCFNTEYKYQTGRNEYIELKREMKEERNRIKQAQMYKELEEEGERKVNFVQSKFDKIKDSELLLNNEFVKQLVINSSKMKKQFSMAYSTTKELAEEYEKILKEQGYLFVSQIRKVRNSKYLYEIYIRPILGHMHDIDCDMDGNLTFSDRFNLYTDAPYCSTEIKVNGYIFAIIEIEEDEVNNYEGIFQNIESSYSDVDNYYENFGVRKVIATENSDSGIKAIELTTKIEFPMGIQEGYNEKLFSSILLIENKFKSKLLYSFFNTKTLSRIKYESERYIRYALPFGNKVFISFYNNNELVLIDLNELKIEEKFVSQYIDGSEYCYSLVKPDTKELYFLTNKLYNTGLKAISNDLTIKSVMFSDRYIVFNENRKNIENDCKVFDAKIGKYIVKNGKFKNYVKNMRIVHEVFDVDKNKTISLDY